MYENILKVGVQKFTMVFKNPQLGVKKQRKFTLFEHFFAKI